MPTHLMTERAAAPISPPADLYAAVSDFAQRLDDLRTPEAVLDAVHGVSTTSLPLNVFGAARFPLVSNQWISELGKSAFLTAAFRPAGGKSAQLSGQRITFGHRIPRPVQSGLLYLDGDAATGPANWC